MTRLERRSVLKGAAAVGLVGFGSAVTGCSSADQAVPPPAGGEGDDAAPTPDTTANSDTGAGDTGAGDPGDGDPGDGVTGLVAASEVAVGGGVVLRQQELVVTQPTEGAFKASRRTAPTRRASSTASRTT
ncbi:MAG: hypothetical protein H0U62_15010 [Actinobacteria bacterium]|nr:hypothetical protein [Actinomycetota bacterium]